jgi:hypothetical protein
MRSVSARYLRSTARAAVLLAAMNLAACAVSSPPPPSGGGESSSDTIPVHGDSTDSTYASPDGSYAIPVLPDTSAADYDRMFIEIHAGLVRELRELDKTGRNGTRLAEIQSIVKTAEEFYLEGNPLVAIRLLTEAELLLRQVPRS